LMLTIIVSETQKT